jgi:hypothetical protein
VIYIAPFIKELSMISLSSKNKDDNDYDQMENIKQLLIVLAQTINAPYNWREIGEELKNEFDENDWEYEQLELWNH